MCVRAFVCVSVCLCECMCVVLGFLSLLLLFRTYDINKRSVLVCCT